MEAVTIQIGEDIYNLRCGGDGEPKIVVEPTDKGVNPSKLRIVTHLLNTQDIYLHGYIANYTASVAQLIAEKLGGKVVSIRQMPGANELGHIVY